MASSSTPSLLLVVHDEPTFGPLVIAQNFYRELWETNDGNSWPLWFMPTSKTLSTTMFRLACTSFSQKP